MPRSQDLAIFVWITTTTTTKLITLSLAGGFEDDPSNLPQYYFMDNKWLTMPNPLTADLYLIKYYCPQIL